MQVCDTVQHVNGYRSLKPALSCAAWHRNIRMQRIKAPKIHMLDSGLTCYLLGIRSTNELRGHPLRGAIFESWVT
ncbi:MAG: hypothetical protein COV99_07435 [Bacteroidetes bacterium CG12_big_fil_rev_8_21_14_0_65_60_17]|nr:MAG: hypothetical protein COV99_07435 [Bacteroidetes bacterium CG12_big_fil_rev_8_21_14_0_65_60_17]